MLTTLGDGAGFSVSSPKGKVVGRSTVKCIPLGLKISVVQ